MEFPYPETFDDDYATRELTAGRSMAMIAKHMSREDLKQTPPAGMKGEELKKWLNWGGAGEDQTWTPDPKLKGEKLKKWKFQTYIKDYLRCIRSVDDNVGRVLDYLKDNGLDKNTIVIYMGDQGFYLGEHGWYDKRWMYEESLQMPCLVRYPNGIRSGTSVKAISLNIDIAPTLLEYAGIEIPEDIQGKSLKSLLEQDKKAEKTWRKSMYYQYFEYPKWHNVQPHYGIRTERYKLIHYYFDIDAWELFDLQNDPNELRNLYNEPKCQELIEKLEKELYALQKEYKDDMPLEERRELTRKYMIKYSE